MDQGLEKNVIIARSGVYKYDKSDLRILNLPEDSIPEEHKWRDIFSVYTPSTTLIEALPLFSKLPLTKEHPPVPVTPDNYSEYAKGWTGDSCEIVNVGNEVGISSTCNLFDRDVLEYYDNDFRDVSPGYFADYEWENGTSPDGEEYQIVKRKITGVNHLAFTRSGRGGPEISLDSYVSLEYYSQRMTTDSNSPSFREVVTDIAKYRNDYNPDEIRAGLDAATGLLKSMPNCQEKTILTRVMKDFDNVKSLTSDSAAQLAAETLANLFEEIDKKIMEESTVLFKKKVTTDAEPEAPPKDETPKPDAAPETTPASTEAPAPVPDAPAEEATVPAAGPGETPPEATQGGEEAPVAPAAAVAMDVAQMPDDLSAISDEDLLAVLNGIVKCLKADYAAKATASAPVAETPVADSDMPAEEGMAVVDSEEKPEKEATMDSIFRMPVGDKNNVGSSLKDFAEKNFTRSKK